MGGPSTLKGIIEPSVVFLGIGLAITQSAFCCTQLSQSGTIRCRMAGLNPEPFYRRHREIGTATDASLSQPCTERKTLNKRFVSFPVAFILIWHLLFLADPTFPFSLLRIPDQKCRHHQRHQNNPQDFAKTKIDTDAKSMGHGHNHTK